MASYLLVYTCLYMCFWIQSSSTSQDKSTIDDTEQIREETSRDCNRNYVNSTELLIVWLHNIVLHLNWFAFTLIFDDETECFVTKLIKELQKKDSFRYRLLKVPENTNLLQNRLLDFYLAEESHYKYFVVVCGAETAIPLMKTANNLDRYSKRKTYMRHYSKWLLMTSHHTISNLCYAGGLLDHVAVVDIDNIVLVNLASKTNITHPISGYEGWIRLDTNLPVSTKFRVYSLAWVPAGRAWVDVGLVDIYGMHASSDIFPNTRFGFNGRKFIVTTKEWPGFVIDTDSSDNHTYIGFCIDLLNGIAKRLNFTYQLIGPADGEYGSEKNGTWTGIMGQLVNRSHSRYRDTLTVLDNIQEVDFTMAALSVNAVRDVVIDYISTPLQIDYKDVMYRKLESEDTKWRLLLDVFHPLVLLTLGAAFVLTSLLLFALLVTSPSTKLTRHKKSVLIDSVWYTLGSIFQQGGHVIPSSAPARMLVATWWIMTVVMASIFSANFIAFLAVPKRDKPFSNLEELLQNKDYKWGVNGGGSTEFLISTSPDPKVQAFYKEIVKFNKSDNSVLTRNIPTHFQRIKNEKYAFVYGHGRIGHDLDCNVEYLGAKLLVNSKAFAVPDRSPVKVELDEIMIRLLENGVLKFLTRKWLSASDACDDDASLKVTVTIRDIQSAFYVLCIGLVVTGMSLVLERAIFRFQNKSVLKL